MTRDEIERHIGELNRALLGTMTPYPAMGANDEQLEKWRKHHDRFRGDIELLEFLLARLPPRAPRRIDQPYNARRRIVQHSGSPDVETP
jgi:hypothetical protein